jgi:hypothetical protein
LKKSKFIAEQVNYWALLSPKGICGDLEKVAAVQNLGIPSNRKELQSYIGLCTFICGMINQYSKITMTDLLSTKNNSSGHQCLSISSTCHDQEYHAEFP